MRTSRCVSKRERERERERERGRGRERERDADEQRNKMAGSYIFKTQKNCYICVCVCVPVCMCVCMHACLYVCVCVCVYMTMPLIYLPRDEQRNIWLTDIFKEAGDFRIPAYVYRHIWMKSGLKEENKSHILCTKLFFSDMIFFSW